MASEDKVEHNVTIGVFMLSSNPILTEASTALPINWLVIDLEASPSTVDNTLHMLQSIRGSSLKSYVRVKNQSKHNIEHALDLGAHGVIIPKINNAEEALLSVEACFYPPKGKRGVNPIRASNYFQNMKDYFLNANERISCIVQIESTTAVQNCDTIAAVNGVDCLFIGTGDLAASYGQIGNVSGKKMKQARKTVLEACEKHSKVAGIFAGDTKSALKYIEEGFKFIALGNDIKHYQDAIINSQREISEQIKKSNKT